MDQHTTYTSLSTLRNISAGLETQLREKHKAMQNIKNDFLSLQRQYFDLVKIIEHLEEKQSENTDG